LRKNIQEKKTNKGARIKDEHKKYFKYYFQQTCKYSMYFQPLIPTQKSYGRPLIIKSNIRY
jgi:uncharacterized protein (DUF927 family)